MKPLPHINAGEMRPARHSPLTRGRERLLQGIARLGWVLTFAGIVAGLWYALIAAFSLHPFVLPAPHQIFAAGVNEFPLLVQAAQTTLTGAALGFVLAVVSGVVLAIALLRLRPLRMGLYPLVLFLQMTPLISVAAIIVILFDTGLQSVILIAFFIGFFPIVASTLQGLRSVPSAQRELFQLYRASRSQELWQLRIPHALPYFFTGAKIAATLAVIGSVTGEIFAGSSDGASGLGFLMLIFKSELKIAALYAATVVCCLMGFLFVGIVQLARHASLRHWHESAQSGEWE